MKPCGHERCTVSGTTKQMMFGRGGLDETGYFREPCHVCARAYEKSEGLPRDTCWPPGIPPKEATVQKAIELSIELGAAQERIRQLEAARETSWVFVNQLPDTDRLVIIWDGNELIVGHYSDRHGWVSEPEGVPVVAINYRPTHWLELPATPSS